MTSEAPPQQPAPSGLPPGQWTLDTLREHLSMMIAALERHTTAETVGLKRHLELLIASSERAADLLREENAEWRRNANEWRSALDDFVANTVSAEQLAALNARVDEHRDEWRREVSRLSEVQATGAGRSAGIQMSFGAIAATVVVVAALVGAIVSLI